MRSFIQGGFSLMVCLALLAGPAIGNDLSKFAKKLENIGQETRQTTDSIDKGTQHLEESVQSTDRTINRVIGWFKPGNKARPDTVQPDNPKRLRQQLRAYKQMYDDGLITEEEFKRKKTELLSSSK
jgi:Short C-terminal domain